MIMFPNALVKSAYPVLAVAILLLAGECRAEPLSEPAGYIMKITGDATVTSRGQTIEAAIGQAIMVGATLRTGAGGAIGVTLSDNTVLSLGSASEFILEEYQFEPARDALRLSARITGGTLSFIPGGIGRLAPEAVEVKTPTGTVGVRNAHVLLSVDG